MKLEHLRELEAAFQKDLSASRFLGFVTPDTHAFYIALRNHARALFAVVEAAEAFERTFVDGIAAMNKGDQREADRLEQVAYTQRAALSVALAELEAVK